MAIPMNILKRGKKNEGKIKNQTSVIIQGYHCTDTFVVHSVFHYVVHPTNGEVIYAPL